MSLKKDSRGGFLESSNVTKSGAAIADNAIVRGDGGGRGVRGSDVFVTDEGVIQFPKAIVSDTRPHIHFTIAPNTTGIWANALSEMAVHAGGIRIFVVKLAGLRIDVGDLFPSASYGHSNGTSSFRWKQVVGGAFVGAVNVISASATANDYDDTVIFDGASAATLTMPTEDDGRIIRVKNDGSATLTFASPGTAAFEVGSLAAGAKITMVYSATKNKWYAWNG